MFCTTTFLAAQLIFAPGAFGQTNKIIDESSNQLEQTFSCGEYFMQKVATLGLAFNRFFNDPYFVFKDCDGQEQRVFIACGCGATGYEITKYGKIYHESEQFHPQLDRLIALLEDAVRTGALIVHTNGNGETVYLVECL